MCGTSSPKTQLSRFFVSWIRKLLSGSAQCWTTARCRGGDLHSRYASVRKAGSSGFASHQLDKQLAPEVLRHGPAGLGSECSDGPFDVIEDFSEHVSHRFGLLVFRGSRGERAVGARGIDPESFQAFDRAVSLFRQPPSAEPPDQVEACGVDGRPLVLESGFRPLLVLGVLLGALL